MASRIVSALAFFLALYAVAATAQKPARRPAKPAEAARKPAPAPKPGSAAEEFYRLNDERKVILAKLADLKLRYQTANDEQQGGIKEQWEEYIAKGEKVEPALVAAAEKAYADAPNADGQIADFLVTLVMWDVQRDNYEPAARIATLLMEHKCADKRLPLRAAVAALATSDYDAAERYFKQVADSKETPFTKIQPLDNVIGMFLQNPEGFKKNWAKEKIIREDEAKTDNLPRVLLKTTKGDIELELFENEAPNTVASFIALVERDFYKDVPFHRVLQGFMAQGGDPTGKGTGGPGYRIRCECYKPNHRLHFRGTLSMAREGEGGSDGRGRDTGGSQFFLTFTPTAFLDDHYTVFGRVVKGMDVLAKIQRRDPDKEEQARPDKIIDAKVLRKRAHEYKPEKMPE